MKTKMFVIFSVLAILLAGSMSAETFIANDADGDGVADSVDNCPAEDASYFDRDGDGCVDAFAGARHTEYWGVADTVVTYVINQSGVPGINDGSDLAAVQNAMNSWAGIPNTGLFVSYGGTVAQANAAILDQVSLVTFIDDEYQFGSAVLAVGIATSFTVDSLYNGRLYRPGEIVDADMIFNPVKPFTTSGGFGTDVQATATHEAGHLYGIAHSAVKTATMHYVLPQNTQARTLESDDELVFLKAYPDPNVAATANRITGTVTDGSTANPVPGAIVFAIDAATGDTTASDYTMPDGSYAFVGLPDGGYYISIYPINGTSAVNYLQPAYINALVETTAVTLFVPEYWDVAESANDNAADMDAINIAGGAAQIADLITNIDVTPPTVVSISPSAGEVNVRIDAALLIQFSEPIDAATLSNNFRLRAQDGPNAGSLIGGNAAILNDDSVVAFTPSSPYTFDVTYQLTLNTDSTAIADKYGNPMAALFVSSFVTQPEPPLSISNLSPNKGVVGNVIVVNGAGFDPIPDANTVTFNGVNAAISAASPNRLVVKVPEGAGTGPVMVTTGGENSNSLTFTLLSDVEIARGFEVGVSGLSGVPNALVVTPSGGYAYVATDNGASAVVVDEGLAGYLGEVSIPVAGGMDAVDVTPDGRRVYGVSRDTEEIHVFDSNPGSAAFNSLLNSIPTRATPLGIVVDPTSRRAFVSTPDSVIQVWDVNLESATYERQVGVIEVADASLRGNMAVSPDGDMLLALSGLGQLYVFDLGPDTLLATIPVGPNPHDVVVDPAGQRAYVSDRSGLVSVVSLDLMSFVQDITTGGSVRGLTTTPGGTWLYSADDELNHLDVIDLHEENATFRTVAATIDQAVDPADVDVSPNGLYAYSITRSNSQLVATAVGLGPYITSLSHRAGNPGHKLVIAGGGYDLLGTVVDFNGVVAVVPDYITGTSVIVTVPAGATSGPVRTVVTPSDEINAIPQYSNGIYYEILGPTPPGDIRLGAVTAPPSGSGFADAMAISPLGDLALVGGNGGEVYLFDIDPASSSFNQWLGAVAPLSCCITDVAFTPDGKEAFIVGGEDNSVPILNVDRYSNDFGKLVGEVVSDSVPFVGTGLVKISPNGEIGLVYDNAMDRIHVFDLVEDSPTYREVTAVIPTGTLAEIEISPDGLFAVLLEEAIPGIWTFILDPFDAEYLLLTGNLPFGGSPPPLPRSAAFYPDGDSVLVWAGETLTLTRFLFKYDTRIPNNPFGLPTPIATFGSSSMTSELLSLSPRGDRLIRTATQDAIYCYDLTNDWFELLSTWTGAETQAYFDVGFTPDASRYLAASTYSDSLLIFDFSTAQTLSIASGQYQIGVAGQPLAAPLAVQVSTNTGQSLDGVAIQFEAPAGGTFAAGESNVSQIIVATDDEGVAEAHYTLGPALGTQNILVTATGLAGSPLNFIATAVEDPATLPLQFAQILPAINAANVSVSTAIQVTFSRGVDPATITDATLYLHESGDATPVPVAYGFSDGNRKVSLTPINTLAYSTSYVVEVTAAISDDSGGALVNPASPVFQTQAQPPPTLASVAPPAGTVLAPLVLSGTGFDPVAANNTVLFNDVTATPTAGGVDFLNVRVPSGATSGLVRVAAASDTSNARPFNVLVPSTSTVDDVIASVSTGNNSKTITVSPDGAIAYSVSSESDLVIPIGLDSLVTYESISVGDNPVAIVIHPFGTFAYVANFGSASLSIIDTDSNSPDFHSVDTTLVVGANPIDVAVLPDGSRVLVANGGASSLTVVDADSSSATHNTVIASVSTGKNSKTITVSPDGTRIYIGTEDSIEILESIGYSVIASVSTGKNSKTITVSPDGTLLFVLTSEGDLLIVDVEPGSATENSVIASVSTGNNTKTITVSPDGALVYLVQEDSDEVIVINVETIGSVSALEEVILPPKTVHVAFVDTIQTGEDPEAIAFDPTGSGRYLIATEGDRLIKLYGEASREFAADVRVTPRTLNLDSRGRFVKGSIGLAPPATVDATDIDVLTVLLQESIPIVPGSAALVDEDGDGIEELIAKFDRAVFQEIMPQGEYVPVKISGEAGIHTFAGWDTIRTIRPTVTHPAGGEFFTFSALANVTWTSPGGTQIDHVDVHFTSDDGATWSPIAERIPDQGSVPWAVPVTASEMCRVMVTLYRDGEPIGMGMSPGTFSVAMPVSVKLTNFEAAIEDGAAVMRWTTGLEAGTEGFHLVRSEVEDGLYERVTDDMIAAKGVADGARYEYRDDTVRPNRRYYYKLQEIATNGFAGEYGPYELVYRLTFGLEQNSPNPFNPTTTIRFSIAEDSRVLLVVYDVAGRRVRTLVDGNRRANVYKEVWDGTNDTGGQVATGVYFYRLTAGKFVETKKMLLLK